MFFTVTAISFRFCSHPLWTVMPPAPPRTRDRPRHDPGLQKTQEAPSVEGIRVPRPGAHLSPKGHEQYQLRETDLGGNATISGEPSALMACMP
jgi:hypothetical protein